MKNSVRGAKNFIALSLIGLLTLVAISPLAFIFSYVLINGVAHFSLDFFTEIPAPLGEIGGGMANALVGSLILIGLASLVGVPLGILLGVYLSEFPSTNLTNGLRLCMDLLTSAPSIVIGIFVYTLLVIPMKGFSAISGAAALSIIMLPIIVKSSEEVLKLIPNSVREAGLALGLPRWRVILFIVLRASRSAITTGVILAVARVSGESAPLLFTAFGNQFWSTHLGQPVASLPVQIYLYAISPYEDWQQKAWTGALVLLLVVFLLNILTRVLTRTRSH